MMNTNASFYTARKIPWAALGASVALLVLSVWVARVYSRLHWGVYLSCVQAAPLSDPQNEVALVLEGLRNIKIAMGLGSVLFAGLCMRSRPRWPGLVLLSVTLAYAWLFLFIVE